MRIKRMSSLVISTVAGIAMMFLSSADVVARPDGDQVRAAAGTSARWDVTEFHGRIASPIVMNLHLYLPVLRGSTARNRRLVREWVRGNVSRQRASLVDRRRQSENAGTCAGSNVESAFLFVGHARRILARRYAATALYVESSTGCGPSSRYSEFTRTWDLRRGRVVRVGDIVRHPYYGRYWSLQAALQSAIDGEPSPCAVSSDPALRATEIVVRRFTPLKRGIAMYFNLSCGVVGYLVKWEEIALTERGTAIARFYGRRGAPDRLVSTARDAS